METTDVVVIGAGPAGLAVGACLKRRRINFVILEREQQVGSSWRRHYDRLRLHTVKSRSSLPFRKFDRGYPRYIPRALVVRYLEEYATAFGLQPLFGENVKAVRKHAKAWLVESTSMTFRSREVVVASGLNAEPVSPRYPGVQNFRGQILHAADYVDTAPFVGQRVLVVGMGNTGAEIALDLCEHGIETTISIRGGVHIAPRDLFGLPIQIIATVATRVLPLKVNDVLFPVVLDFAIGDLSKYGIVRPRRGILEQVANSGRIPVLDVGTAKLIRDGKIHVARNIRAIAECGVIFDDGEERPFEAIIFATGFRPGYRSFLQFDNNVPPSAVDPSISFVGFKNPVTGLLREISREAQSVARNIERRHSDHPASGPRLQNCN